MWSKEWTYPSLVCFHSLRYNYTGAHWKNLAFTYDSLIYSTVKGLKVARKRRIHTGGFMLFSARNHVFNASGNNRASNGPHRLKRSAHSWRCRLQFASSGDDAANGRRARRQALRYWWSLLHWQWSHDSLCRSAQLPIRPDNTVWRDLVHSTFQDRWGRCYLEKLNSGCFHFCTINVSKEFLNSAKF